MTFETPYNIDDIVVHTTPENPFNASRIVGIEAEIFIKVEDLKTGEIRTFKPDQKIFSLAHAKEYVDTIMKQISDLEQAQPAVEG